MDSPACKLVFVACPSCCCGLGLVEALVIVIASRTSYLVRNATFHSCIAISCSCITLVLLATTGTQARSLHLTAQRGQIRASLALLRRLREELQELREHGVQELQARCRQPGAQDTRGDACELLGQQVAAYRASLLAAYRAYTSNVDVHLSVV